MGYRRKEGTGRTGILANGKTKQRGNEKRRTRNGERGTGNDERRTTNGERGTRNEERGTENGVHMIT